MKGWFFHMRHKNIKLIGTIAGAIALVTLLTLVISPWKFLEEMPRPQANRTAEARPPLEPLNRLSLNCRVGQRCQVRWGQSPGWGWVQATARNDRTGATRRSSTARRTCTGPRHATCQLSHTFPRPAPGFRWVSANGSTEGRSDWRGKRCF
jgi:hypothetical protein